MSALHRTTSSSTPRTRSNPVALVAAVTACVALAACSGSTDPAPTPDGERGDASSSSAPTVLSSSEPEADAPAPNPGQALAADLIDVPRAERRAWVAGATEFLAQVETALDEPDPQAPTVDLDQVSGPALEALVNTVSEFEANGWRVEGRATIVSEQVVRRSENPATVVMRVCVDNSQVRVVDAQGAVVPNSKPASPRTLNIMALSEQDGRWVVTEQRAAPQPDC